MQKILVSACMMGQKVRYNASDVSTDDALIEQWRRQGRLIPFCPELAGGFPVPRPPAEIETGKGGEAVLDQGARVLENSGDDVTRYFRRGAELTLDAVKAHGIKLAILKEGSPSCGSAEIYDGTFSGKSIPGVGVTTALLKRNGIKVFSEQQTTEAADYLRSLEQNNVPNEDRQR